MTATTPKIPTGITATEPVMLGSGIVTALVYMLQAAGIITVPEAQQLGPQLNAAIVAIWPLVIMVGGYIGRHYASSPATVAQISAPATTSTPPVAPAPVVPSPAPTTTSTGSTPVALTVISSTDLPAGTEGSIAAGTRRWSLDGERLSDVGPAIVSLVAIDNVKGDTNNGHFYRTGTNPAYRLTMSSVSLDGQAAAAEPTTPYVPGPVAITSTSDASPEANLTGPEYSVLVVGASTPIDFLAQCKAWDGANRGTNFYLEQLYVRLNIYCNVWRTGRQSANLVAAIQEIQSEIYRAEQISTGTGVGPVDRTIPFDALVKGEGDYVDGPAALQAILMGTAH